MNKKILTLTALAIFGFAGCQKSETKPTAPADNKAENKAENTATETKAPSELKIGVAIYDNSDTFMSTVKAGIDNYAKTVTDVKLSLKFADGQRQQATQDDQVNSFITQGVNAVCINMVDRTSAGPIIEKLKAENIPVVFFNRQPTDEDMKRWDRVYYVGARPEQSGEIQANIMYEYWTANTQVADKNGDGKLQYVILTGEPGHQDAIARTKAVKDFFEQKGLATDLLAEDTAMWQRVDAQAKMEAFLASHGDTIEAVLANNDDMALGAIEALKAAGYFAEGKYMPVLGIDATAPAKDAVASGMMLGTVINDAANQGKDTLAIAINLAMGRDVAMNTENLTGQLDMVPYQPYVKQ